MNRITGPEPPIAQAQNRAGFSRADQRRYRRGPAQKRGVGLTIVVYLSVSRGQEGLGEVVR